MHCTQKFTTDVSPATRHASGTARTYMGGSPPGTGDCEFESRQYQ